MPWSWISSSYAFLLHFSTSLMYLQNLSKCPNHENSFQIPDPQIKWPSFGSKTTNMASWHASCEHQKQRRELFLEPNGGHFIWGSEISLDSWSKHLSTVNVSDSLKITGKDLKSFGFHWYVSTFASGLNRTLKAFVICEPFKKRHLREITFTPDKGEAGQYFNWHLVTDIDTFSFGPLNTVRNTKVMSFCRAFTIQTPK